jgi:hypothetical protein
METRSVSEGPRVNCMEIATCGERGVPRSRVGFPRTHRLHCGTYPKLIRKTARPPRSNVERVVEPVADETDTRESERTGGPPSSLGPALPAAGLATTAANHCESRADQRGERISPRFSKVFGDSTSPRRLEVVVGSTTRRRVAGALSRPRHCVTRLACAAARIPLRRCAPPL